jgi:putative endonuclease
MTRDYRYFVYILASKRNGTLYTGITSNLANRTWQHKNDLIDGFTKRYGVHRLVWFEEYSNVYEAIGREKQIKGWNRAWKIRLIEKQNPEWMDLFSLIIG